MSIRKQLWESEDARGWLARHRLPADEATVALVAERLRARRGWVIDRLVVLLVMTGFAWLVVRGDVWSQPDGNVWLPVFVIACVAGDVLRRRVMWRRWDRRPPAPSPVRMASLRPATWDDLVGRRAVRRAAVLLVVMLGVAVVVSLRVGVAEGAAMAFLVVAAAAHAGVLLEVARRRPLPAGDETALAVNDRLRGEEANHAATEGLLWVVLAPVAVWGLNAAAPTLALLAYLYVVTAVRHRYAYEHVGGRLVAR